MLFTCQLQNINLLLICESHEFYRINYILITYWLQIDYRVFTVSFYRFLSYVLRYSPDPVNDVP